MTTFKYVLLKIGTFSLGIQATAPKLSANPLLRLQQLAYFARPKKGCCIINHAVGAYYALLSAVCLQDELPCIMFTFSINSIIKPEHSRRVI